MVRLFDTPLDNSRCNRTTNVTDDLELVATMLALKIWRHYLYGVYLDVFTDHKSLQYVFTQKELTHQQRSGQNF